MRSWSEAGRLVCREAARWAAAGDEGRLVLAVGRERPAAMVVGRATDGRPGRAWAEAVMLAACFAPRRVQAAIAAATPRPLRGMVALQEVEAVPDGRVEREVSLGWWRWCGRTWWLSARQTWGNWALLGEIAAAVIEQGAHIGDETAPALLAVTDWVAPGHRVVLAPATTAGVRTALQGRFSDH